LYEYAKIILLYNKYSMVMNGFINNYSITNWNPIIDYDGSYNCTPNKWDITSPSVSNILNNIYSSTIGIVIPATSMLSFSYTTEYTSIYGLVSFGYIVNETFVDCGPSIQPRQIIVYVNAGDRFAFCARVNGSIPNPYAFRKKKDTITASIIQFIAQPITSLPSFYIQNGFKEEFSVTNWKKNGTVGTTGTTVALPDSLTMKSIDPLKIERDPEARYQNIYSITIPFSTVISFLSNYIITGNYATYGILSFGYILNDIYIDCGINENKTISLYVNTGDKFAFCVQYNGNYDEKNFYTTHNHIGTILASIYYFSFVKMGIDEPKTETTMNGFITSFSLEKWTKIGLNAVIDNTLVMTVRVIPNLTYTSTTIVAPFDTTITFSFVSTILNNQNENVCSMSDSIFTFGYSINGIDVICVVNAIFSDPTVDIKKGDTFGFWIKVNTENPNIENYNGYSFITRIIDFSFTEIPISNICFVGKTKVKTDQGEIFIKDIHPKIHTIEKEHILAVTRTISDHPYLVCFEKHSLGWNIPSQRVIMTIDHKIWYQNKWMYAKHVVNICPTNVYFIEYKGEILYNILMHSHGIISVGNMICETLHPDNKIAKLFIDNSSCHDIISQMNNAIHKKDVLSYKKILDII